MIELGQKVGGKDMPQTLVYFSKIVYEPQTTMFRRGYKSDIQEVIDPSITTLRYNRTWRFSKPQFYKEDYFVGKLGFVSSGKEQVTFYDEKAMDFLQVSVDLKPTYYVQWILDLSTHVLAFETKFPDIKFQSFMGAFSGLLDKKANIGLTVEHMMKSEEFFMWVKGIDKLIQFKAKIRKPNPKYHERTDIVNDLLQKTNADSARVEISKAKDSSESLNTETTIKELVDYAKEGYSDISAQGLKSGHPRQFDSRRKSPAEKVDIPAGLSVEKIWDHIIEAYGKFRK